MDVRDTLKRKNTLIKVRSDGEMRLSRVKSEIRVRSEKLHV